MTLKLLLLVFSIIVYYKSIATFGNHKQSINGIIQEVDKPRLQLGFSLATVLVAVDLDFDCRQGLWNMDQALAVWLHGIYMDA